MSAPCDRRQDLDVIFGGERLGRVELDDHLAVEEQTVGFAHLALGVVQHGAQTGVLDEQGLDRGAEARRIELDALGVVGEAEQRARELERHDDLSLRALRSISLMTSTPRLISRTSCVPPPMTPP